VTCTDQDAVGVATAEDTCQELNCAAIDSIAGGQTIAVSGTGCDDSSAATLAGTTCAFQCQTGEAKQSTFAYVTCSKGELLMCADAQCGNTFGLGADGAACVAAGTVVTEQEVVSSTASITLSSAAARRLSGGLEAQLESKIAEVKAAFTDALATTLSISKSDVVIESHALATLPDGSVVLTLDFYGKVAGGASSDALVSQLAEISSGGDLAASLKSALVEAVADIPGLDVTVGDIAVSEPVKATVFVADTSSGSGTGGGDDEEGGGSVGLIAGVVVVVVLLGGAAFFVMKKKSG